MKFIVVSPAIAMILPPKSDNWGIISPYSTYLRENCRSVIVNCIVVPEKNEVHHQRVLIKAKHFINAEMREMCPAIVMFSVKWTNLTVWERQLKGNDAKLREWVKSAGISSVDVVVTNLIKTVNFRWRIIQINFYL